VRVKINITGIVQGVGFRPFVYRTVVKNNLKGHVRNRGDAGVEILLEGNEQNIQYFMQDLKENKPPLAQMHEIITARLEGKNKYREFAICESSKEARLSGSVIPPDVAICNNCLRELRDPNDPRFQYFFITCTDCGPRFTIIERLPYDRENTTMREFPLCGFCESEYTDPLNRRFHAQTVACPECGPQVRLTTAKGELTDHDDPIRVTGKLLSEGCIVAIKGYGGFHVATSVIDNKPLTRLREVKHRSQKPFATMARSLEAIQSFAEVSRSEAQILTSYSRPIVLLNKNDNYWLSDLVAPSLHNIGVMLPYTGLHYMLFDDVDDAAFVMTSANPPNQPLIKDNDEALQKLGDMVDYFLFHNRQIAHRCDDSVARMHGNNVVFIRRSRGFAPAPIMLKEKTEHCIVGLGGEQNNTACVLLDDKAFISQHIGDVENIETKNFLENAAKHLTRLTNSKADTVVCDLHPKFTTTKLGHELARENKWQLFQIQHHYAHVAGLMVEHNAEEIVGVCCDGYGYGVDGEAWGGEIILGKRETPSFKRVAHLEKQPLIGGDMATRYPLRMAAGMLNKKVDVENWLLENVRHFPHGERETRVILEQLRKNSNFISTTSCGRVLDAVAAVLGVCYERTYEGEPAMKLESIARGGRDVLKLKPICDGSVLHTSEMLLEIFANRQRYSEADLAYSAHVYLAKGLATMAIETASANNIRTIGFTGGVACNEIMTLTMRKIVESAGLELVVHQNVPPGDGGLSFGQAVACAFFHS
jgi:hydrogenase maturation protein HypF